LNTTVADGAARAIVHHRLLCCHRFGGRYRRIGGAAPTDYAVGRRAN